ncbi:MAG: hypothetical protein ABIR71_14555, partial [Chthoniobacterales bacterium]
LGSVARGAILEDVIRQGYDLSADASVSIRNTDGRILVFGSEGERLEIIATRRAFSKERLEAIKVAVTIDGNAALIETILPPAPPASLFADRSGTVDYVILVPQNCTLAQVELANGEMLIEGMRGPRIEARLGKGILSLNDCFSAVQAGLGQGRMKVRFDWWEPGTFSLVAEVAQGELRVALPPVGAALQIDAVSTQGKVLNDFSPKKSSAPRLDEQFGNGSAVEFKLRASGHIRLQRAY